MAIIMLAAAAVVLVVIPLMESLFINLLKAVVIKNMAASAPLQQTLH